jgi:hypothetical protein
MLGLDHLLAEQVIAFLLNKYTIIVNLLTIGPFLVRGAIYRRARAATQARLSPATAGAAASAPFPARPPRRFASYPFLTTVGALGVLAYAGITIGASIHLRLNPPPSNLNHFTLPFEFFITLIVWGVACLVGIVCALYVVVRSIQLRRWDWLVGIIALLLCILAIIESGNDRIGDTFFSILIFGPASAIIFGLFGPSAPRDLTR